MLVPHSHGGLALSVPAAVPVVEALSAADSSASWVTMIAVTSHTFCTRLPTVTYDRLIHVMDQMKQAGVVRFAFGVAASAP